MLEILLILLIFIWLFYIINKFKTKKPYLSSVLKIILFSLLIEVFIFNINSFRTVFKNYKSIKYNAESIETFELEYDENDDTYVFLTDNPVVEICNINEETATLKLDAKLVEEPSIGYTIYYTDSTSKNYRALPEKVLVNDVERSKYSACYLSGCSEKIAIKLNGEEGYRIKINNITINEKIPFNFSFIRFAILSLTIIFVYSLIKCKIFNEPYSEKNYRQKDILSIILILFVFIITWINITSPIADGLYGKYVDSIMNGKIHLSETPSEELQKLENPYDNTQRGDIEYLWDTAYYNDTYYVYFGILPALILFIPIKLLGSTLPVFLGVLLFSIGISINLFNIVKHIYKKWFSNLDFSFLVLAVIGILSGSLIFWINRRPSTYEIVLSAGIYFVTLGFWQMFKAIEDDEIKYKYLCLSATSYALAVACRPNLLLVSLCYIPIIIKVLKENIKNKNTKNTVKTILLIGIPYVIIGILLMIFNYIRFDNPFEFGTSYQLTVNDMHNLKNRTMTIPVGIFTQLFKLPVTTNEFPFYAHQYSTMPFFGYYYVESFVCGLFVLNPINYMLLFLIGLKKKIKEKEAYNYTLIYTVVAFVICILTVVLAGTLQRYSMDYAWILNIASYLTIFIIVSNIKSVEIKKYILKIIIAITMFMFFANIYVGGLISENNLLKSFEPEMYYKIMYNICFWE